MRRLFSKMLVSFFLGLFMISSAQILLEIPKSSNLEESIGMAQKDAYEMNLHPMFADFSNVRDSRSSKATVVSSTSTSQDIDFQQVWYFEYHTTLLDPNVMNLAERWVSLEATFWIRLTLTVPVRIRVTEPNSELLSGTVQQARISVETLAPPQYLLELGVDFFLDYYAKLPSEFLTVGGVQTPIPTAWEVYTPDPRPTKFSLKTNFTGEFWPFSRSGPSLAPWGFTQNLIDEAESIRVDLKAVPWYEGKLTADLEVSGAGSVPTQKTLSWNAIEDKIIPIEVAKSASDGDSVQVTLHNFKYQLRCGMNWYAETKFQGYLTPLQGLLEFFGADSIHLATFPQSNWISLVPSSSDPVSLSMTTIAMKYNHVNIHVKKLVSIGVTEAFPLHENTYAALTLTQWNNFNNWRTELLNSESVATFVELDPTLEYCWILMIDGVIVATSSSFYTMGSSLAPESERFVWDNTEEDVDLVVTTDMSGFVNISFSAFNSTDDVLTPMKDTTIWIGKIEPTHGDYWWSITNPESFNNAMMGLEPPVDILSLRYLVVDDNGQTFWTQNTRPNGEYKVWVVEGYDSSQGMFTTEQILFEKQISITQSGQYVLIGDQTKGADSLRVLIDREAPTTSASTTTISPSYEVPGCLYVGRRVEIRTTATDDIEVPLAWAEFTTGERFQLISSGNGHFYGKVDFSPMTPGNQDLTVRIMDVAGNEDYLTIPIYIDNAKPILNETSISTSTGMTTFSCEAIDDSPIVTATAHHQIGSTIKSTELEVIPGSPTLISGSFEESDDFYVEVIDLVGNKAFYDTTCPTLSILEDYDRIDMNHVRLHTNASDFGSGLAGYLVFFNGTPYFSSSSSSFVIDLRVPSIGPANLGMKWAWNRSSETNIYGIFSGDLNGDGHDDLIWRAIKHYNKNGTWNLLHLIQALDGATGSLCLNITLSDTDRADWSLQPIIDDFTGNGKDEIAFASMLLGNVRLFDGETGSVLWTFSYDSPIDPLNNSESIDGILSGDFDNDGKKDLLIRRGYGADAIKGTNGLKLWTWEAWGYMSPGHYAIGDYNMDGYSDVYVIDYKNLHYINGKTGAEQFSYIGKYGFSIAVADVSSSNGLECVTIVADKTGSIHDNLYENLSLAVWLTNGTWLFYDLEFGVNSSLDRVKIEAVDVDQDGLQEIIVYYSYNNGTDVIYSIFCFDVVENRTIWSKQTTEYLIDMRVADVDEDGAFELLIAYSYTTGKNCLRIFDARTGILLAQGLDDRSPNLSVIGDFNSDGQLESVQFGQDEFEFWSLCNDAGTLYIGGWVNITVVAEDHSGNNATDFIIIDITDMNAPNPPAIIASSAGDDFVSFSWSASTTLGVLGYELYRGVESSPSLYYSSPIAKVGNDVFVFNDTSLPQGKYHYFLVAVDSNNARSVPSNEIVHRIGTIPDWEMLAGPEPPWGICIERTESNVTLTWNLPSSEITGLRLYKSEELITDTIVGVYCELDGNIVSFSEQLNASDGFWYALTSIDALGRESSLSISLFSGVFTDEAPPDSSPESPSDSSTEPSFIDSILGYLLNPLILAGIAVVAIIVILAARDDGF